MTFPFPWDGAAYILFSSKGNTALSYAVLKGNLPIVNTLLFRDDYDGLVKSEIMSHALLQASKYGFIEIVELLLSLDDVDVNPEDDYKRSPLSHAAENGHDEVTRSPIHTPHTPHT